jgi:hypothetical protein
MNNAAQPLFYLQEKILLLLHFKPDSIRIVQNWWLHFRLRVFVAILYDTLVLIFMYIRTDRHSLTIKRFFIRLL